MNIHPPACTVRPSPANHTPTSIVATLLPHSYLATSFTLLSSRTYNLRCLSLVSTTTSTASSNTPTYSRNHEHRREETYYEGQLLRQSQQTTGLTLQQEYTECMTDTPSGMKINFNEQNMTKWEVLMDGPDQSIYAVSASRSHAGMPTNAA
jgi:hypothetical protein